MSEFCCFSFAGFVALRKESVDRNINCSGDTMSSASVALRKESVDRNTKPESLNFSRCVALRKESVDRNNFLCYTKCNETRSLSARRAWIEIPNRMATGAGARSLSARRAWIEIRGHQ